MESVVGEQMGDGVLLTLVDVEELRKATVNRDLQEECPCEEGIVDMQDDVPMGDKDTSNRADVVLEHGSVVRVAGDAPRLRALTQQRREGFESDLMTFSEHCGLRVELECPEEGACFDIVLCGEPDEIRANREEMGGLLKHYGLASDSIEVDGMIMQSLPARNRRKRKTDDGTDAAPAPGVGGAAAAAVALATVGKSIDAGSEGERGPAPVRGLPPRSLPNDQLKVESGTAAKGSLLASLRDPVERRQFEFRDHTADVILHSWGRTLEEALEQVCVAFFAYMTELDSIDLNNEIEIEASGHDILDLVYHMLDELLFSFGTELIICRRVELVMFDEAEFKVRVRAFGERFDLKKHPQGTEIKAITMHQLKINYPDKVVCEAGTLARTEDALLKDGFPYEIYVLVDI